MHGNLEKRLTILGNNLPGDTTRYFVWYTGPEPRFVLPGGIVTDADTFTQAVERAGRAATVIEVVYADER